MKPSKNRFFCPDSGRLKTLFETEKKANTFIKFNSEEIASEKGFSPIRSYFCIACNGWHVTSKSEIKNIKSKTEIILELYQEKKEKRKLEVARNAEIKKYQLERLNKHLENVQKLILQIESNKESIPSDYQKEILNNAYKELEMANSISGATKRKKELLNLLNVLRSNYNIS